MPSGSVELGQYKTKERWDRVGVGNPAGVEQGGWQ